MKKKDMLLVITAMCGELPTDLAVEVVGSGSYTAAVITRLKQDGYIAVRNKNGCKGYVLKVKGRRYVLENYRADTEYFLLGPVETSHVKSEVEKRLRLHRMGRAWVFCLKMGIPVFRSQKPELFGAAWEKWAGERKAAYYGSLEFKGRFDTIKGSRACGLLLTGESGYAVYHSIAQRMRWAKKTERSMNNCYLKEGFCPRQTRLLLAILWISCWSYWRVTGGSGETCTRWMMFLTGIIMCRWETRLRCRCSSSSAKQRKRPYTNSFAVYWSMWIKRDIQYMRERTGKESRYI